MIIPALVDWPKLTRAAAVLKVTNGGCDWVSRASIEECLRTGLIEDPARPQSDTSNHAARVAGLVRLLRAGVDLDAMELHVARVDPVPHAPRRRLALWFADGSHRFRAYEFVGMREPLAVVLSGDAGVLAELLTVAGEAILPEGAVAFVSAAG